jgi:superfamily I DNA and RNA helicase
MENFLSIINSNSTSGERSFFYRIEDFFSEDDNVLGYFEPELNGFRPDFLLLSPNFGVIIAEVKDYLKKSLKTISKSGSWEMINDDEKISISNPFDQLYQYWRVVKDKINHSDFAANIDIPIIRLAVFSQISESSLLADKIRDLSPKKVYLCFKEVIGRNEKFSDFIKDILPHNFILDKNNFNILRGNIIPTCRLPTLDQANLKKNFESKDKIKLLDEEQEELARELGEGHRLIFGVAGSGKTILLIARARYLAIRNPTWNILVLCYNRLLRNLLFHLLNPQDYEADINISTFHSWARGYILSGNDDFSRIYEDAEAKAEQRGDLSEFFQEFVPKLLLEKLKTQDNNYFQYDAILIDEAQDFEEEWFKGIIELLNPKTNSLLITCDGLQGIYARKRFTWSSVGIQARGRVRRFEKSYRTPIEIGLIAQEILPPELRELIGKFDEFLPTKEYIGEHGIVELIVSESKEEEYEKLAKKIMRLRKQSQTILLLFKYNMAKRNYDHPMFGYLRKYNIKWKDLEDYNYESSDLLIGTLHGTKGLEFDTIIIPEIDSYKTNEDRQLLYVGITRSRKKLILSGNQLNGSKNIINSIKSFQT